MSDELDDDEVESRLRELEAELEKEAPKKPAKVEAKVDDDSEISEDILPDNSFEIDEKKENASEDGSLGEDIGAAVSGLKDLSLIHI